MISVCMATYNGESFIKEQMDSILCQLDRDSEVIVSDDGSTDNTLDIIRGYQDPRIKIVRNPGRRGFAYNYENALKHASGDYIFLSDQDDLWLPGKVETLSRCLAEYQAVFSDAVVVDRDLRVIADSFFKLRNAGNGILKNIIKNRYFGFGLAFRKELLAWALPFPIIGRLGHDVIIGLLADMRKSILFLPTPLTLYRRHGESLTAIGLNRKRLPLWRMVASRMTLIFVIIKLRLRLFKNIKDK